MVFNAKVLVKFISDLFQRPCPDGKLPNMSLLAGDINLPYGVNYRIAGLRPVRDEGISHDYDVIRIWSEANDGRYPREENYAVMKIAYNDNNHEEFMNECRIFIALSEEYSNWRHRRHFPEVLGTGSLSNFTFHGKRVDSDYQEEKLSIPRPFFIVERLGLTLEEIRFISRHKFIDSHLSIYLVIGSIKALRLLHDMGYIMREVSPSRFSIRMTSIPLLGRNTNEIAEKVAITSLPYATKYRSDSRSKLTPNDVFVGTVRYSSTEAMGGKKQGPKDDIISALYILLELVLGYLPWDGKERAEVMKIKSSIQGTKDLVDKGGCIFKGYADLFKVVYDSNTDLGMIPYEKLYALLHTQTTITKNDVTVFGTATHIKKTYHEASYVVATRTVTKTMDTCG